MLIKTAKEKVKAAAHRGRKWRPSIRTYLTLMNLILLCLLFPVISLIFFNKMASFRDLQLERTISQMRQGLESRGSSQVRSMALSAEEAISGFDFSFLNTLLRQVMNYDTEIVYCLAMDVNKKVWSHSDPTKIGDRLTDELSQKAAFFFGTDFPQTLTSDQHPDVIRIIDTVVVLDGKRLPVMEIVIPIYSGLNLWGVLRCGYSLIPLETKIDQVRLDWSAKMAEFSLNFFTMTGIFFCLGVLIAAFFTRLFVRSTQVLSDSVYRIAAGDLEHQIAPQDMFCVEFRRFSEAFNDMTGQLRFSYRKLEAYSHFLEDEVEERTRELKEAQAELLQQAHEAGMAEMAVGVLHNIGNAITPAKVGATLMLRRLRESPMRHHLDEVMRRVSEELQTPGTVGSEEKKRLTSIVQLLPGSIREESERAIAEIDLIRLKHEHIESIINLQMRYARLIGEQEEIDVNRVVADALKILAESIRNRQVEVVQDLAEVPKVRIEQTKLIQILINLLKNGLEAMEEGHGSERKIFITTSWLEEPQGQVLIAIRDTGCGFAPGTENKFFKFGYTTKKTGSGFGLHSSANYLIANNGSISVHSPGLGKGAEFVVRLAVAEQKDLHFAQEASKAGKDSP